MASDTDRWRTLLEGKRPEHAPNRRTCFATVPTPVAVPPTMSFRAAFIDNYAAIRVAALRTRSAGILVAAVSLSDGRVAGLSWVAARVGQPTTVIVGRHGHCDLYLDADPTLALRHVAVIVDPIRDWGTHTCLPAYRVIDLRTDTGLIDEAGAPLYAYRCEGPSFFRAGAYAFLILGTGDATDWPDAPEQAWSFIPERVYLDEQREPARGSQPQPLPPEPASISPNRPITLVARRPRVSMVVDCLLRTGETPIGHLCLVDGTTQRISVGPQALANGVLVGRYDRCDHAAAIEHPNVSRVHALMLETADGLYLIDTASTNGLWTRSAGGESVQSRIVPLDRSPDVLIGGEWMTACWRWAQ